MKNRMDDYENKTCLHTQGRVVQKMMTINDPCMETEYVHTEYRNMCFCYIHVRYTCLYVCVCIVPVREWISGVICQFEKSPATAQVSSLTCRLKHTHTQKIRHGCFPKTLLVSVHS